MIRFQQHGAVGVVTIDRPAARNAIDIDHAQAIALHVDRIETDSSIRVGILAGVAGSFCAGGDLKVVGAGEQKSLSTEDGGFCGLVRRVRHKPMIAAVDGPAVGGGFELVLACDLVIATRNARFGLPEVRRGVIAASGGLSRLPRLIPRNLALELALTGATRDAAWAERFGLISRLVDENDLMTAALDLAAAIAANSPVAVRESRALLLAASTLDDAEGMALGRQALERVMASADAKEGSQAFLEKRAPRWIDQ